MGIVLESLSHVSRLARHWSSRVWHSKNTISPRCSGTRQLVQRQWDEWMLSIFLFQINFNLENQVLREALEDLQRRKKEIQADNPCTQVNRTPVTMPIKSVAMDKERENKMNRFDLGFSCLPTTSVTRPSNLPSETNRCPGNVVQWSASASTEYPSACSHLSSCVTGGPSVPVSSSFTLSPTSHSNNPSTLPSYRLPSVRDIYWPSTDHHHHVSPMVAPMSGTSNMLHLPTPIHSSQSSPVSVKQNNRSLNNCDSAAVRDLAATFDERLTSGDPFHDAELRSLNDATELRHLYSTSGSAHTIQR